MAPNEEISQRELFPGFVFIYGVIDHTCYKTFAGKNVEYEKSKKNQKFP